MKEDKKADGAARKKERSGGKDRAGRDKKAERQTGSYDGVQRGECRQRLGEKKPTGEEG